MLYEKSQKSSFRNAQFGSDSVPNLSSGAYKISMLCECLSTVFGTVLSCKVLKIKTKEERGRSATN